MNWTATILKHCDDGLTMEVEYAREGYDPITVGTLLPPKGADLQAHLAQYAPRGVWDMIDERRVEREAPAAGTVVSAPQEQQPAAPPPQPVVDTQLGTTSEVIL